MSHRQLFAALAATAALALAGCGDDEPTSTTTGASGVTGATGAALSEEEFLTQANAICQAGSKEIERAGDELFAGQQPTAEQIEQYVSQILVPGTQGAIDAIRALPAPAEIQAAVNTFLDDAETALGEIEADPSLAQATGDGGPFADVNVQAEELGLTECAG